MEILLNWRIYFAVPLVVALLHASLNYSGFCFREMRYLSDEEKFRIVFEMFNSRKTITIRTVIEERTQFNDREQIKYESFEQFIQSNPDCCAIVPGKPRNTPWETPSSYFWDRITGYNSGEVIVMTFIARYLDENGDRTSEEVTTKTVLKNCGKIKGLIRRIYD